MPILSFTIRDKVMDHVKGNPYYVCGNSDYVVKLDMDNEWGFALFTAVIKWYDRDGIGHKITKEFVGDSFEFPLIYDATRAEIGIYAGDKHTTTPGIVACRSSILTGELPEEPPTEDVYTQIIALIEAGAVKGKSPYIGEDNHWFEWDTDTNQYVDTGIRADYVLTDEDKEEIKEGAIQDIYDDIRSPLAAAEAARDEAISAKDGATASATSAMESDASAQAHSNIATQQAEIATQQAEIATQQAEIATQQAEIAVIAGGWTEEQIRFLESFKDAMSIMIAHIGYDAASSDGAGQAAARDSITALTRLVASLRDRPHPVPTLDHLSVAPSSLTVTEGTTISELADSLTVKAVYNDESEDILVYGDTYQLVGNLSVGENSVQIMGLGDYAELESITVMVEVTEEPVPEPVIDHLTVSPSTLTVREGVELSDLADSLTVKAVYTDDSEVVLSYGSGYTLVGSLVVSQPNTIAIRGIGEYSTAADVNIVVTVEQDEPVVTSATLKVYHYNYAGTVENPGGGKHKSTSGSDYLPAARFSNPLPTKPVRFTVECSEDVQGSTTGNQIRNATYTLSGGVWTGLGKNASGANVTVTFNDDDSFWTMEDGKCVGESLLPAGKVGATTYFYGKWIGATYKDAAWDVFTFYTE